MKKQYKKVTHFQTKPCIMLIYDSQINIYLGLLLVIFKFLILLKNVIPNIYLFFFNYYDHYLIRMKHSDHLFVI